jgi:hypothetical protein
MNNPRRKTIDKIIASLDDIKNDVTGVGEEEQEYRDNAPENMMYSEKYERAEEVAQILEEISDEIYEIVTRLEEVKEAA